MIEVLAAIQQRLAQVAEVMQQVWHPMSRVFRR